MNVIYDAAAEQSERNADGNELGIVKVVQCGVFGERRPERAPRRTCHPHCTATLPRNRVDSHAAHDLVLMMRGHQDDVEAGCRKCRTFFHEDPYIGRGVRSCQVYDATWKTGH
jgi:hypothetical protein